MLMIPLVLPGLVLILGWNTFWAPSGYGSSWLQTTLGIGVPFNLYSITGMAMVAISVTTPIVFFFVRGVLVNLDSALEDAARASGASPLRSLLSVTVPMLRPAILNSGMLVFALALEVLGLALILGSPSDIDLIGSYLYGQWIEEVPADQGLVSARDPTIKLEGSAPAGYETMSVVGIRDPAVFAEIGTWDARLRDALRSRVDSLLGLRPGEYEVAVHYYGWNAVLGDLELRPA